MICHKEKVGQNEINVASERICSLRGFCLQKLESCRK